MQSSSYVALSAEIALRSQLNTVSNNLANMNTTGYKSQQMLFKEHLNKNVTDVRALKTATSYVEDMGQYQDMKAGSLIHTGNNLDVALGKPTSFFAVNTPQGKFYTRKGSFTLDATRQLVTNQGYPVLSSDGAPITFSENDTSISIAKDGTVSTNDGIKGKLGMFAFDDVQSLKRQGNSFYKAGDQQTANPDDTGTVQQGYLEGSNVSPILETTHMINLSNDYTKIASYVQKHYEQQSKMLAALMVSR